VGYVSCAATGSELAWTTSSLLAYGGGHGDDNLRAAHIHLQQQAWRCTAAKMRAPYARPSRFSIGRDLFLCVPLDPSSQRME
jgi:hypothetical protein